MSQLTSFVQQMVTKPCDIHVHLKLDHDSLHDPRVITSCLLEWEGELAGHVTFSFVSGQDYIKIEVSVPKLG
jgi:hypothetical protein